MEGLAASKAMLGEKNTDDLCMTELLIIGWEEKVIFPTFKTVIWEILTQIVAFNG